MKVCIAEKPSVARETSVLGANTKRDYYEGNGYALYFWPFMHLKRT
jgi:hypothetical protein